MSGREGRKTAAYDTLFENKSHANHRLHYEEPPSSSLSTNQCQRISLLWSKLWRREFRVSKHSRHGLYSVYVCHDRWRSKDMVFGGCT